MATHRLLHLAQIATGLWCAAGTALVIGTVHRDLVLMLSGLLLCIGGEAVTVAFFLYKQQRRSERLVALYEGLMEQVQGQEGLRAVKPARP